MSSTTSKSSSSSIEKFLISFGKFLYHLVRHVILTIGRFFGREIPLQWNWLMSTHRSMRSSSFVTNETLKYVLIGFTMTFFILVLLVWAGLRAIFVPNHHP
jgi:hypothetical protein